MQRFEQHAWPMRHPAPLEHPVVTHMPPRHASLGPHARPQAPQLELSLDTFTQRAPQQLVPGAHVTPPQRGVLTQTP